MVRVLVDATAIPADRGGVGRYLDELLAALAPMQDGQLSVAVAAQARDRAQFADLGLTVRAVGESFSSRPVRLAWEQTGLPVLAHRARVNVVHSPHYTQPLAIRTPTVVTVHDATFFSDPKLHLRAKARFFRVATRLAVRRARRLITPSAATADELVRFTGASRSKIVVAPHGVDHATFAPPTEQAIAALRESLGLGAAPFISFLGTIEPRKNVGNLIRGWVEAVSARTEPPVLVLAGGSGWDESVDAAIAAVPRHLRVIRPGYLPLEQVPALLGGAELVVYPSLGEGFGLPVLEAMACGGAVLTTRLLSLPEVGGDAVAYTGPEPGEIAAEIAGLLDAPDRRAQLRRDAVLRASEFSWRRTAELHVQAYRAAAAR